MQTEALKTVGFAAAVCVVCSIFVAGSAVSLRDRQEENRVLDLRSKVLLVSDLADPGEALARETINQRFQENLTALVIDLETGEETDIDPLTFDQRAAAQDPEQSEVAPPNTAKVSRVPDNALIYQKITDGEVERLILPIQGYGLWSTLYGFIALSGDLETIQGITFYEHGETAGLGGEVDNPRWQALWPGRKAFGEGWEPEIEVIKGAAGPVASDPYRVDGLAGATLTSRGVTNLLHFWLGENGFGPYLERYRADRGIS
ncbi:Na(+)-translocating NADH-quinone reductase subunit C [Gaopeijia maritima]|uniref:Na(+)-translocating NADH-quinone reductase subunit C n=1 Tax=Gaopeijia maritima TaxID=3119007 RepID=A0ABU9E8E0_9BACT